MAVFAPRRVKKAMRNHFVMNAHDNGFGLSMRPKPKSTTYRSPVRRAKLATVRAIDLLGSFLGPAPSNPLLAAVSDLMLDHRRKRKVRDQVQTASVQRHHQHRGS